jgi:hypothetical protein
VLANDLDADSDTLSATLVSGPKGGSFSLASNGGFTYAPDSTFSGGDGFTYRASDGAVSSLASVTITVTASPSQDTVAITAATYTTKTRTLLVKATSDAAPDARLTLVGYGLMSYSNKTRVYTYQKRLSSPPSATVKVLSSGGGTATAPVEVK